MSICREAEKEMNTENAEIMSCLISLMQMQGVGLKTVAVCADAIAADARFNLWVGLVAKESATSDRMVNLIESYDLATQECLNCVAAFNALGDVDALERSLCEVISRLKREIAAAQ